MGGLTTTSYAVLGLLSLRSWTTYELAKQMERSLHFYWPRAESGIYEEPKRLVALGLASVERQHTGKRPRTVYAITEAGRSALAEWVRQPGSLDVTIAFEAMVRVNFADSVTTADLLALLRALRAQAEAWFSYAQDRSREYLETGGPFPHRLHLIALVSQFVYDYHRMVAEWAAWAEHEASAWPEQAQVDATDLVRRVFGPWLDPESLPPPRPIPPSAR
jgi:DNA-binding PadR family transcriptional regulator